jgi:hypothetical protein
VARSAGVVPKPKHYGYGTTPSRYSALQRYIAALLTHGGQFAQLKDLQSFTGFQTAPILDSDYSDIVNLVRDNLKLKLPLR